ncbi:MAG: hypothetical protein WC979_02390 [Candidatus Pacearchaeota archaeon]|jgi:hypothetical protein|nr:hypothetical protein [Clostridia bacterium]
MQLTDSCFTKSFYMMGQSLKGCLNCSYCRLTGKEQSKYEKLPSSINPLFRQLPVAVNLFYGDPLLQVEKTIEYLRALEADNHKGPVIIITKGEIWKFPDIKFDLDLHFAFSTFGINSKYDGGSLRTLNANLSSMKNDRIHKYQYSIEFRPVIKGINDSQEAIENIVKIAKKYDAPIGFCGLQVTPELANYFKENNINFEPYEGYDFGLKKAVSKEVEDIFYNMSEKYNVPVFRKTSCLISYSHGLNRDYNAHYYRPNEMRCSKCVMNNTCKSFIQERDISEVTSLNIPFKHTIINKDKHVCYLFKSGVCKFANPDCTNIKGKLIKIEERITSSDVRVIKWLTGYTVDCEFDESEFISDKWSVGKFAQMIDSIKNQLESIQYTNGDLSDIGNEIGISIAKHLTEDNNVNDFIHGVKHGISLIDGTH